MSNVIPYISELNEDQRGHLAWRLDHFTAMGAVTASKVAQGLHGDWNLVEAFTRAGRSEHSAKIQARKVINYRVEDHLKPLGGKP